MATYNTSDFRKGLKVLWDGEPCLVVESNFRKPGKGNAIYTLRLKNLLRGTVVERNFHGGESIESADIEEIDAQFLYKQVDTYVFMENTTYEQYELSADQVDDNWKYLKEGLPCSLVLWNNNPITITPPNHVELKVEYCEPGAKGDTATNVTKSAKVETGAEFIVPSFIKIDDVLKIDTRTGEYVERVRS
ncbi:MAG: elongation factor P [Planctomycetales bacterium]|nr:elongation factor P [Planctomycetales bacterium]